MVYRDDFAVAVVTHGDIAREQKTSGDTVVKLPFGTDYGLRFKNLHGTRAVLGVTIDGKDVMDGEELVIAPNSSADLRGFMENGSVRKAFRFIKKTEKISKHRGDRIDDGLIRVEWRFEVPPPQEPIHIHHPIHHYYDQWHPRPRPYPYPHPWHNPWERGDVVYGNSRGSGSSSLGSLDDVSLCSSNIGEDKACASQSFEKNITANAHIDGITVEGEDRNQNFHYASVGQLEQQRHVVVIHLQGKASDGVLVREPVLVRSKINCSTCGTKNDSRNRFCVDCGTSLT